MRPLLMTSRSSLLAPDPKKGRRVHDKQLLRALHGKWRDCVLCGSVFQLSLHHILKHPRDDVEPNLVMLCGDGVRGCHGAVEAHDGPTLKALATYLLHKRPDTVAYIMETMGAIAAADWFRRQMGD